MRLTTFEINTIVHSVALFAQDNTVELRLFGSRTNDKAKGGDIDLLLVTKTEAEKNHFIQYKIKILVAIKDILGEQRIDLKIASIDDVSHDPFLQLIYPQSVLLQSLPKDLTNEPY